MATYLPTSGLLNVSLAVLLPVLDVSSGPQKFEDVISLLCDMSIDFKIFARPSQDLSSCGYISCSVVQDLRKCRSTQNPLYVHFICINIFCICVSFAQQAYIVDRIKNVFMPYIVNCYVVSLFSILDRARYHTIHDFMFMILSTFLFARQHYNPVHITLCCFVVVSVNLCDKAVAGFPQFSTNELSEPFML